MIYTSYMNGDDTEQYQYYFRPFMTASGELIGGYTTQNAVNDIINNQKNDNQEIKNSIESGNKAIIDTIKSGDNAIISAITNTEISGDILGNINMFDEIRF